MIIDFDDINTYPIEIIEYANKNNFSEYNKEKFNIDYPEYFNELLNKYKFIVYHSTRTLNINNFKKYGILIPSDERLKQILYNDTDGCDLNDYSELIPGRGGDIQFTFSYDEICNDSQFIDFFENIGGEIVRGTKKYDAEKLKKCGNCYIIKFLIEGSTINFKRLLIQKMIRKVKYDIRVDYHGSILCDILPEQIIEYIKADDIYKKLREMI